MSCMSELAFVDARQVTMAATAGRDRAFVILPILARMLEPVSSRVAWRNATVPRVSYYYVLLFIIIIYIIIMRISILFLETI